MPDLPPHLPDGQLYIDRLTDRQRRVVDMVFCGKTNREISECLEIATKTVEKHRKAAMRKMQVESVVMLTRLMCRELSASTH